MKSALLLGTVALSLGAASAPPEKVDLLIRGGTIYTGSSEPFTGDVAIRGDRIVKIIRYEKGVAAPFMGDVALEGDVVVWTRPRADILAARTIDAKGMIVAPGFIDPHTHMEADLTSPNAARRLVPAFLMQGVTTAFIGNDGGGSPDVAKVLGSANTKPVGINYAAYVGFGEIRGRVVGAANRAPTEAEMTRMKALVANAMCHGALGLSTGLFYAPQSFAKTEEVIELAKEAGKSGGSYDSHIRDESSYTVGLSAAIDEAIRIGREGGLPSHISHIKALGVDVHGQAGAIIVKIEAARAEGLRVTADQYPWSASGTSLVASLVPFWAQDGGRPALLKLFDDAGQKQKMRDGITENLRKRGGAEKLLIVEGKYRNQTLAAVASALKLDAVDAAITVIRIADPGVVSFNQDEADIETFMKRPWVMTGSDASGGHPRVYGSFARKYAYYVHERHVLTLGEFIYRSATLTADTFGLTGRGHLTAGAFADVVVFDPKTYAAQATYESPRLLASGMRNVVVNGVLAVDSGKMTGKAAGRALPHKPTAGSCG